MYITHIYGCVKTFTCIRIPRNSDDALGSGSKVLLPSWLLGFRHEKERDTIFTMLTVRPASALNSLTQQTRVHPAVNNWNGIAQIWIPTRFVQSQISLLFSKYPRIPAHRFRAWRNSHPQSHFLSVFFYYDICDCPILPACAWTPALMSAPTRALSRMVLSLTKPKDKI